MLISSYKHKLHSWMLYSSSLVSWRGAVTMMMPLFDITTTVNQLNCEKYKRFCFLPCWTPPWCSVVRWNRESAVLQLSCVRTQNQQWQQVKKTRRAGRPDCWSAIRSIDWSGRCAMCNTWACRALDNNDDDIVMQTEEYDTDNNSNDNGNKNVVIDFISHDLKTDATLSFHHWCSYFFFAFHMRAAMIELFIHLIKFFHVQRWDLFSHIKFSRSNIFDVDDEKITISIRLLLIEWFWVLTKKNAARFKRFLYRSYDLPRKKRRICIIRS